MEEKIISGDTTLHRVNLLGYESKPLTFKEKVRRHLGTVGVLIVMTGLCMIWALSTTYFIVSLIKLSNGVN